MIQVFHILLVAVVAYFLPQKRWLGWVWLVGVLIANLICGGCPITLIANKYFEEAGNPGFSSLALWVEYFVGSFAGAAIIFLLILLLPWMLGKSRVSRMERANQ